MSNVDAPVWRKGIAGLLTAVLLAAASIFIVVTPSQSASPQAVPLATDASISADSECTLSSFDSGRLEWGIKQSFRNYIVDGIAQGSVELSNGVTQAPNNEEFTFSQISGEWDNEDDSGRVAFTGSITFEGHHGEIDLAFLNPVVEVDADGTGRILLDIRGTSYPDGEDMDADGVIMAEFDADLSVENDNLTIEGTEVLLTEDGSTNFLGLYPEGDKIDDLTINATLGAHPDCETEPEVPAPSGSASATVNEAGDALVVNVIGENLPGGVYAAVIERGRVADLQDMATANYVEFALPFPAVVDGAIDTDITISVDNEQLDRTKEYEVVVWRIHSAAEGDNLYFQTDLEVTTAQWDELFGTEEEPVDPEEPVTWEPEFDVFLADGETPYTNQPVFSGDTLVIRGSGFDPEGNVGGRGVPIPNTLPQGTYLVFGHFAETWQPSEDAASFTRAGGSQQWLLTEDTLEQIPEPFKSTVASQWAELNEDGTFDIKFNVQAPSSEVDGGSYGIYSYGAGGVNNADQEIAVPINYVGVPEIEVFLSDGVTPYADQELEEGEELVVRGTNFGPNANIGGRGIPIPNTLPQGAYVVFGNFADDWEPSDGEPSGNRKVGSQGWVLPESVVEQIPPSFQGTVRDQWVELDANGSFETTLEVALPSNRTGEVDVLEGGNWGVYTYGAGGVNNADQELQELVNFEYEADVEEPVDPEPTPEPTPDPTPTPDPEEPICTVVGFESGTLDWGIHQSFRNYIVGNIAKGSVTLSPGVTQAPNNGEFSFSRISGEWDEETNSGEAHFAGSLTFSGHNGQMDLAYLNPSVVIDEDGNGQLILDVRGTSFPAEENMDADRVVFATFDAGVTASGDSVAIEGTNVVLTEGGAAGFSGLYEAGTELDDLSFAATLGDCATDDDDTDPPGTGTAPKVEFKVDGQNTNTVAPGQKVSITASGFQPGESVIVTVYSDPIVVGTFQANSNGVVSFDWTVPMNISPGLHRMVLLGSETGAIEFQFTVALPSDGSDIGQDDDGATTPAEDDEAICVARQVNGATLSWGVKTSFREYIVGPIANGSLNTSGVSANGGQYTWSGGSGAFNTDAHRGQASFNGSVQFTGHSGLLDLNISNPRVQITGPNSAQLIADVVSKGYNGSPEVNSRGVTIANLSLSGGQVSGNQVSYSNVPATLTGSGAQAFAGFYNAGDALDSVSFTLPLGGEVDCDSSTGTLAVTGASGDRTMIAAGVLLLFFGAGLVVARRKMVAQPVPVKARN